MELLAAIMFLWFIVWCVLQLVTTVQAKTIVLVLGILVALIWFGYLTIGPHHPILTR
jgi:hypothetical protein